MELVEGFGVMDLVALLVVGLIVGALARFLVPGRDPIGCLGTALLGVAGSFVGGLLASVVFEGELDLRPSSFLGSLVGSIVLVILLRFLRRG